MPKLFLLAVGGTGVRVTKALVNVLAAGVHPGTSAADWDIIPVVLDPHRDGHDLKRTERQVGRYAKLQAAVSTEKRQSSGLNWFGTKIATLDTLGSGGGVGADQLLAPLAQLHDKRFGDYIGVSDLTGSRRALVHALYGEDQLGTHMDIGFVGNPGIGVIALDNLNEHKSIRDLASAYNAGDRIFIVSSIFGGTGAAAFPRILNLFRQATAEGLPNGAALEQAVIGALSVQPYFRVGDGDGKILQAEFMARTRAALRYYARGVKPQLDAFYTLGRNSAKKIENDPGQNGQQNPAHFAELASALAIVHFLDFGPQTRSGKLEEYQYSLQLDPTGARGFDLFTDDDRNRLVGPFIEFYLMCRYLRTVGETEIGNPGNQEYLQKVSAGFANSREKQTLIDFAHDWEGWIREIAAGDPELRLFDASETKDYAAAVNGIAAKAKGGIMSMFGSKPRTLDADAIGNELNAAARNLNDASTDLEHLLRTYEVATRKASTETFALS